MYVIMFSEKVTFEVLFENLKPCGKKRSITAPGSQRIVDALQAVQGLQKIKKDLQKVFLDPLPDSKVKGEPNIGSPCSSIAGGKFKARFHKNLKDVQSLSIYDDDGLKSRKRSRFYVNVSEQRSRSQWITKMEPTKFHFRTLLIDCLPNDTLLSALLRDGRIDNSKMKKSVLSECSDHSVPIVQALMDDAHSHHDSTFVSEVIDEPQVSEDDWQESLRKVQIDYGVDRNPTHKGSIGPTVTQSPSYEGRTDTSASSVPSTSGSTPKVGNPGSQENKSDEKMYAEWQTLAAKLLKLDLLPKESEIKEKKRRKKLDKFAEPFVQEYHNVNQGTTVLMMSKLIGHSVSVGVVVKNDHCYGTCFRVGPKFVLTNKHVTKLADLSSGSCNDAFVEFNYLKAFPNEEDFVRFIVKDVKHSQDDLDYCILELDIPTGQFQLVQERLPGLESLIGSTSEGSTVTIIGHPGGQPKKLDVRCPVLNPNNNKVTHYLKIHPSKAQDVYHPGRTIYKSTFAHGSSGSPGFDQYGNLVVMHTRGYPLHAGSHSVLEQGIRLTAIHGDLRRNKPDLFRAIFPPECWDTVWPGTEEHMDCS
uniref:Serine protease n=1 Tax=Branchiostoma floridae TaxID=7739 RepID=C3YGN4_BRAFL|eukprot:XP_002604533.1 hypothetical protein BRAFLDRAFT_79380 [Branchiostoma floridae]